MSALPQIEVRPVGDSAIIVHLGEPGSSRPLIDDVLRVRSLLQQAELPGVVEMTTALTTVAIFYNPVRVPGDGAGIYTSLESRIRSLLMEASPETPVRAALETNVEIPVCCEPEFALDLEEVARCLGLAPEALLQMYFAAEYRVGCLGFTPGFPYLTGLPPELAMPRRAIPRAAVPAGSVAIGGTQAGIYPTQSPGGWNVLGRTLLRLFDPAAENPSLLRTGDRVRFRRVTGPEYNRLAAEAASRPVQAPANK